MRSSFFRLSAVVGAGAALALFSVVGGCSSDGESADPPDGASGPDTGSPTHGDSGPVATGSSGGGPVLDGSSSPGDAGPDAGPDAGSDAGPDAEVLPFVSPPVMVTEQATRTIAVFDPAAPDWNQAPALLWSWGPPADATYVEPVAARLRRTTRWGGLAMVVGSTAGYFGVVAYPGKEILYEHHLGLSDNLHGVELLPNGNVAVAATGGGFVRIYVSSAAAPPASKAFVTDATNELAAAYNVLWDGGQNVLWALASKHLCGYANIGTADAPALSGRTCFLTPTTAGRDLQPFAGDPNLLVLSTATNVYTFDKTTKLFAEITDPAGISRGSVNGISRNGGGQWVETVSSGPAAPPCGHTWATETVDFLGVGATARKKTGACIYRAAYWTE